MWETIRKFGLGYCDLPVMIWNISVLLRTMSLNIHPDYTGKISVFSYIFTFTICFCYFYVYVFSMIWFVVWQGIKINNIISAMVVLSLGISSEISTVKLIYMFIYQNTLRKLMREYLDCDAIAVPDSRFSKNRRIVLRQVKKRAIFFWIMLMSNGAVYAIKPLLLPGRHVMEDIEFLYGLQPLYVSPNYEIAYFLSLGGVIFACYVTANITGFVIMVAGNIEAQMLALSEELVKIWDNGKDYYQKHVKDEGMKLDITEKSNPTSHFDKEHILNEYIKQQLDRIIKMHTKNIHFLQQIEQVFRSSIAIEFGLLIVSLIAEFLGGLENTYMEMPFAMIQVIMDCITGQRLIDASVTFERAVYNCHWENFNAKNMKTVVIMLINSQKLMSLTAGGFTSLSYLCMMTVGRMIYSTYTALRSTMNH